MTAAGKIAAAVIAFFMTSFAGKAGAAPGRNHRRRVEVGGVRGLVARAMAIGVSAAAKG